MKTGGDRQTRRFPHARDWASVDFLEEISMTTAAIAFRTETRTNEEIEAAYLADKAKKDAKAHYDEALRLDRARDAARQASEKIAEAKVTTTTASVLTDTAREESRLRATAEAEAARAVKAGGITVVMEAPKFFIAASLYADGLAKDRARDAELAASHAEGENHESERVRRLAETLEEDIARDEERIEQEKAQSRLLEEGLYADRIVTARSLAFQISKSDMSLDEKHAGLIDQGFVLVNVAKGDKDARYHHEELDFFFWLKGTAPGQVIVERPHKAKGSAAMTREQMEARAVENAAKKAAIKAGKKAKPTAAQEQKAAKKAKAAAAAEAKAAKKGVKK